MNLDGGNRILLVVFL